MLFGLICSLNLDFGTIQTNLGEMPDNRPTAQEYSTNSTGEVDVASVMMHQSYYNETLFNFTESETTLKIPAPIDPHFNTSFIKLEITNITSSNITSDVELDVGTSSSSLNTPYASSFAVLNNCYLNNVTFNLDKKTFDGDINVHLLNSTWDSINLRSMPNDTVRDENLIGSFQLTADGWITLECFKFLNNDYTKNNTWFIALQDITTNSGWWYINDDGTGDNNDESRAYSFSSSVWNFLGRDYAMQVGLGLSSLKPSPSEINLTVNNTLIDNNPLEENAGFKTFNNLISSNNGELFFNCKASWYYYTFQINLTLVNYTKTDVAVSSSFTAKSADIIFWNTSFVIDKFDERLSGNLINISVPSNWNIIDVLNDSESKSYSITPKGSIQEIIIDSDATNGSWSVLASSSNLLDSIEFTDGIFPLEYIITHQTLHIGATFNTPIIGTVNLSIYNPSPSDICNFTRLVNIPTLSTTIDLGSWDVDTNVTDTGVFRVQVTWNNITDAAILERNILVIRQTALGIEPSDVYTNSSNNPFNITISYYDVFNGDSLITGATIGFNNSLNQWIVDSTQNNWDKKYNITINPLEYPIGKAFVLFTVNKTGYGNFTFKFEIHFIAASLVQEKSEFCQITNIIRGQNATYILNYTSGGVGIEGARIVEDSVNHDLIWRFEDLTGGNYAIYINTSQVDVGTYPVIFDISVFPYQELSFSFSIDVVKAATELVFVSKSDPVWRMGGLNLTVQFRLNDTDNKQFVSGMLNSHVKVYNGSNPTQEWNVGTYNFFTWEVGSGLYATNISINGLNKGSYSVVINATFEPNYISSELFVNFIVRGNNTQFVLIAVNPYNDQDVLARPDGYGVYLSTTGVNMNFRIIDLDNGGVVTDLMGSFVITVTINVSGSTVLTHTLAFDAGLNSINGTILLPIDLALGVYQIVVTVNMENYEQASFTTKLYVVRQGGLPEWILYVIIVGIVGIVSVAVIQKGVIAPKKRKFKETVLNTSSVFEDAINMQNILIIYKATGTCVYFKSFGMEQIDPDLISGFLSAAQSFVKESMSSADGLSEMKSGNANLLISDGELVRATLVLGKPASQFLKSNLSRFLLMFEGKYRDALLNWKGQLGAFKETGKLIDEVLHTSVILPHEITVDVKKLKSISNPLSRSLLKIAQNIVSEGKPMFFLAQVISEGKEKIKKKPQEILLGIDELLKKGVFVPIDMSKFEVQPISEQEMKILAQKIATLPNFTNEEKQQLMQDLVEMTAPEREALLASLTQGKSIASTVSKRVVKTKVFSNVKDAKAEISNLLKQASKYISKKSFTEAIQCYETAEVTASQWKLATEAKKYRDMALNTQILKLNNEIKKAKKDAPILKKQGKTKEAQELIQAGLDAAQSMFKLGFSEYDKEVKFFNKMMIQYCGTDQTSATPICDENKEGLIKEQSELLKRAMKAEKNKDYKEAMTLYSELVVVADKIFKFGVLSATNDMKKYRSKVLELKKKINESNAGNDEQLNDQKSKMLNIAIQAEKDQDFIKALVAYQQVLNIHYTIGDTDGATKIAEKIKSIVGMITNLPEIVQSIMQNASQLESQNKFQEAYAQFQYAKGICQAMGDKEKLKTIDKKISELSEKL